MWGWIFNPRFGLHRRPPRRSSACEGPAWLRDPAWAMPAMIVIGLWNVGVNVVVYIAALGDRAARAARCRGTRRRRPGGRFRYVTWPALLPVTFYLAIVNAIAASQVFTPSYVLTRGGPDDATLTTALYTYQTAFALGPPRLRVGDGDRGVRRGPAADRGRSSGSSAAACRTWGPRMTRDAARSGPRRVHRSRSLWSSRSRVPFVWL